MKLDGRNISTKSGKKLRKNGLHLEADPKCLQGYLDELFLFCVKNEDLFVPLGAAGSGGSSKIIQQLAVHIELTFCIGNAGYCIRTAVTNAIAIADGDGAAGGMLELENMPDRSLAAVGAWMESALKNTLFGRSKYLAGKRHMSIFLPKYLEFFG